MRLQLPFPSGTSCWICVGATLSVADRYGTLKFEKVVESHAGEAECNLRSISFSVLVEFVHDLLQDFVGKG